MSKKSANIAALIEGCRGQDRDAHYLGYFECFNRKLYYEAHDVLEELWMMDRKGPNGAFYKGLIQLTGAFVHLQKDRLRPSARLFRMARANLEPYAPTHEGLDIQRVVALIDDWHGRLEATDLATNPLTTENAPRLSITEA